MYRTTLQDAKFDWSNPFGSLIDIGKETAEKIVGKASDTAVNEFGELIGAEKPTEQPPNPAAEAKRIFASYNSQTAWDALSYDEQQRVRAMLSQYGLNIPFADKSKAAAGLAKVNPYVAGAGIGAAAYLISKSPILTAIAAIGSGLAWNHFITNK